MTINNKEWSWSALITCRTDYRQTTRVTKWQTKNCRRNRGRQRTRWKGELGICWDRCAYSNMRQRESWRESGKASVGIWKGREGWTPNEVNIYARFSSSEVVVRKTKRTRPNKIDKIFTRRSSLSCSELVMVNDDDRWRTGLSNFSCCLGNEYTREQSGADRWAWQVAYR